MLRSVFLPAVLACAAAVLSPATASAQIKVGIVNSISSEPFWELPR
jgi:hypothetical protein